MMERIVEVVVMICGGLRDPVSGVLRQPQTDGTARRVLKPQSC